MALPKVWPGAEWNVRCVHASDTNECCGLLFGNYFVKELGYPAKRLDDLPIVSVKVSRRRPERGEYIYGWRQEHLPYGNSPETCHFYCRDTRSDAQVRVDTARRRAMSKKRPRLEVRERGYYPMTCSGDEICHIFPSISQDPDQNIGICLAPPNDMPGPHALPIEHPKYDLTPEKVAEIPPVAIQIELEQYLGMPTNLDDLVCLNTQI